MVDDQLKIEEFKINWTEIVERVKILHGLITLAVILMTVFLISGVFLFGRLTTEGFSWYLLLIPVVFACLTFNYQANQMTMEAVAGYARSVYSGWDKYYGSHKQRYQLTSFLKVLPLLLPLLIPFFVAPEILSLQILRWVDLALLALVIFNFRYKLSRP
ncbi:hypothetical protein A3A71_01265 [Candidatus Berkelbacteria bacterium RIFCSPLOWO2_01_FULL_50_28]|uniref:Uncharacterized protein n=1 Tax=Candidatus Berkelbacteria bacterium RIFCSPLOWO2_01_FULL_50_28 TaxID=1797471 RepID=A0A1F5EB78_9BACT|nr:MAG: hypothetical protein A2807_01835 [Candidatus Berkelbacteria bacterium RIFCSPHIGHO2_01_FULL_50_36]OGD63463.1 MAG: hypothetical protein A3F39_03195 [Candidatus Berkelbacteria bacterium RIFCSPHIGHO2_12_FULL_50_11]OGD64667.1 MAG: hypothetical protein A3A71_01265 [Candidatus Berkelbacteria bacterium RIFCSPLOWO2_01_FULL_50_28]